MEVNGDSEVTKFLPYATWQSSEDAARWFARATATADSGTGQQLVIERLGDQKIIGTVLLFRFDKLSSRVELGYVLGQAYWGQGFAMESVQAACTCAFQYLSVRRIEAEVDPRNTGSNALLQSLGFVREGLLRKRWFTKGAECDTYIYRCLAAEWSGVQIAA